MDLRLADSHLVAACLVLLGITLTSDVFGNATPTSSLPSQPQATEFYREKIHPLLKQHCLKCHGGEKIKGGLNLTSRSALLQGGENGSPINTDFPQNSLLLDMLSYRDGDHEMPPAGKRPPEEIELIRQWIVMGAPFDPALEKRPTPAATSHASPTTFKDGSQWWAYQPVTPPVFPPQKSGSTASNPIDLLLSKSLAQADLSPNGPASKTQLIRRATYDLTGLPPSPEEVERFIHDPAPDAFPRLIDELLAKPQYGEKWARHWMDLVRYAETEGFERDSEKPHIWRYRDYLIEAFNNDLPYDQFLTEQLAGDELPNPTRQSLTATGFLRVLACDESPPDELLAKYDLLADNVLVTAETFLGMSLGCARCHDHKKDPISQKDYFSFMAFFHGMRDYRATRIQPTPWVAESDRPELSRQRRQQIEALDQAYQPRARALLQWLGKPAPAESETLVHPVLGPENAWLFTPADPGPNWTTETFNTERWKASSLTQTRAGQPVWMCAHFGLSQIPKLYGIEIEYAGDTEVFLNGSPVFRAPDLPHGKRFLELSKIPKLRNVLHTGSNVLAIRTSLAEPGRLPSVTLYRGNSPLQTAQTLLRGSRKDELPGLNRTAGADVLALSNSDSQAWLQLIEKPIGIPISAVSESSNTPPPLSIHKRGNPQSLGEPVVPAFPAILSGATSPAPATLTPLAGKNSSGRRLALAQWLVRPENPLVSRVMVNRIWQHHFGRGLVASSNEFGRLGDTPSHPELLDFLAHTFIQNGWSVKSMHRLLMNTEAYQRSATAQPEALAKDPDNRLLWRFSMRRLTAEELRDSILSVSGLLKLDAYGPPVHPPLPVAVLQTQSRPGSGWPKETTEASARRSVYVHVKRSLSLPLLSNHDQAATDSPCAMRFSSTVPTQALGLLNSEFMEEQAALFAKRLQREVGTDPTAQLRRGLQLVFQRTPSEHEIALTLNTLQKFETELHLPRPLALERIALLLLNANEFVYLD